MWRPRHAPTANLALPLAPQLDAPPLHENEDPTSVGKRTRPGGVPEGVLRPNSPRSPSATSPGSVAKAGVIAPLQPAPVMPALRRFVSSNCIMSSSARRPASRAACCAAAATCTA